MIEMVGVISETARLVGRWLVCGNQYKYRIHVTNSNPTQHFLNP